MIALILIACMAWSVRAAAAGLPSAPRVCERHLFADTFFGEAPAPEATVAHEFPHFMMTSAVLSHIVHSIPARLDRAFSQYLIISYGKMAIAESGPVVIDGVRYDVIAERDLTQVNHADGELIYRWCGSRPWTDTPTATGALAEDWRNARPSVVCDGSESLRVLHLILRADAKDDVRAKLRHEFWAREEYRERARAYFNEKLRSDRWIDSEMRATVLD